MPEGAGSYGKDIFAHFGRAQLRWLLWSLTGRSSPWQRGSNANTNRLLRQYFPRGLDMSTYSQAKLSAVARQLNERLRKTLQYQTPAEKFEQCVAAIR